LAKKKLTAQGLKHLTEGEYWDELVKGLHVRVSKTGRKTFTLRYRLHGKQRREKVGVYHPEHYTLASARDDARDIIAAADADHDLRAEKDDASLEFEARAQAVLDRRARVKGLRPATVRNRDEMFKRFLVPAWGGRSVAEITRQDVKAVRDSLSETPFQANRVVSLVSLIFNELLDDELVESNPAYRIQKLEEPKRSVWLDRVAIRKVWAALGEEGEVVGAALRFCLITAQRVGSVRQMRWDEIHGSTWRVPAENFKGGREHWVPLSTHALDVLNELDPEWVFPALRSDSKTGHLGQTDSAAKRAAKEAGVDFRAHDFRETFRTWVTRPVDSADPDISSGCGVSPEAADAVLGHKESTVALSHYHGRPEEHRLAEKRDALEKWGAFVMDAVDGD
jgi:integrase